MSAPHGAMTGVKCDHCVASAFRDTKTRDLHQGFEATITYDKIVCGKIFPKGADWCDLVEHVSTLKDGGYFVWTFAFKDDAGVPNHKTLLIMYIPDEADARTKMLYAASKEALKETLDCGTLVELQAHNLADIDIEAVRSHCLDHHPSSAPHHPHEPEHHAREHHQHSCGKFHN